MAEAVQEYLASAGFEKSLRDTIRRTGQDFRNLTLDQVIKICEVVRNVGGTAEDCVEAIKTFRAAMQDAVGDRESNPASTEVA